MREKKEGRDGGTTRAMKSNEEQRRGLGRAAVLSQFTRPWRRRMTGQSQLGAPEPSSQRAQGVRGPTASGTTGWPCELLELLRGEACN